MAYEELNRPETPAEIAGPVTPVQDRRAGPSDRRSEPYGTPARGQRLHVWGRRSGDELSVMGGILPSGTPEHAMRALCAKSGRRDANAGLIAENQKLRAALQAMLSERPPHQWDESQAVRAARAALGKS